MPKPTVGHVGGSRVDPTLISLRTTRLSITTTRICAISSLCEVGAVASGMKKKMGDVVYGNRACQTINSGAQNSFHITLHISTKLLREGG